jgi:hypothetical protein
VDRAFHCSAEHAASSTQLHNCTCHEPLLFTVALRPVSAAYLSGTSSLAADRKPLHYTATLLYAAANTAGENPVADTKISIAF